MRFGAARLRLRNDLSGAQTPRARIWHSGLATGQTWRRERLRRGDCTFAMLSPAVRASCPMPHLPAELGMRPLPPLVLQAGHVGRGSRGPGWSRWRGRPAGSARGPSGSALEVDAGRGPVVVIRVADLAPSRSISPRSSRGAVHLRGYADSLIDLGPLHNSGRLRESN